LRTNLGDLKSREVTKDDENDDDDDDDNDADDDDNIIITITIIIMCRIFAVGSSKQF